MKTELTNLLYERYQKIFDLRQRSESRMSDGFACGDGWFDLVDALCEQIQFETDKNCAPQVVATQVKEKFGTLRFHVIGSEPNAFQTFPTPAYEQSSTVCWDMCAPIAKPMPGARCARR